MRLSFFACLFLVFISSCKEQASEIANITMEIPLELPAGLNALETHVFQVFGVPTFYDTRLANAGITEEQISFIQAGFGSFSSDFNNVNLDFIFGVTVHALLDGPNGPRREMFYLEQTPLNVGTEIRMLASATELKEVLNKEDVDLEFNFRLREFSPQTFTGKFDLNFGIFIE